MLYILLKYLLAPFFYLLCRPIIIGKRHLYIKGKVIFVCNHISMLDPVMLAMFSPRHIHFMAKAELFHHWYMRIFFRGLLAFPVNRNQADMQSMKKALKVLDQGKAFGIFPEGKRTITDSMDDLEKGAAFLAIRSSAPVIPVYIKRDSYTNLHFEMAVGTPLRVSDIVATTSKSQLVDVVTDEISDSIQALRAQIEK
ncbi:MAG: 1-acyl-sn-glycerol-3-phosphate acyltransferase [Clostridiales bacterium]|jgi:1-acyl-sn-glycerol-3-phosphate acyltransferase|nr:1-acyl-sn-glycerol-3-phosphate acyltransferase [Clostridiales bacterium]